TIILPAPRRTLPPAEPHAPAPAPPDSLPTAPPSYVKRARQALAYLGRGVKDSSGREYVSDRETWLMIGMALHELGADGLKLWIRWSKQCKRKFSLDSCYRAWSSFGLSQGGVTLGTLFFIAGSHGWPGFKRR